ncbi:DUF4394 domain-containing protein [Limnobacter sp.]
MKFKKKFVALALSSLVLGGCFSDSDFIPANIDSYVLTTSNALVGVDSSNGRTGDSLAITGLQASENLFDIDYRNADGRMWALSTLGNLYTIDLETGAATLESTLTNSVDPLVMNTFALDPQETYSIDFNPTVDRLRIIGTDDSSYATNVENGLTATNGSLTLSGAPANGVVVDAAYTDTFSTTTGRGTTLFSIDAQNGALYTQNVMTGALTQVSNLGVAGLQDIQGYDIDPETQQGLAVFQVNGDTALYRVSTSAAATLVSELDLDGETAIGFTTVTTANPTVVGLNSANQVFTFRATEPETISTPVAPANLTAGESLIAIDYSTVADRFFLIGRNAGASSTLYSMPAAGVATAPTLTNIAPLTPTLAAGVEYSIDINPTNGGLRLVGSDDSNAAVNVTTGVVTRGMANGTLNPTTFDLAAHAYTNSISGAVAPTELRAVDTVSGNLVQQNFIADANVTDLGIDLGTNVVRPAAFDIRYSSDYGLLGLKDQVMTQTTLYTIINDIVTEIGPIGGASGATNIVDFSITQ